MTKLEGEVSVFFTVSKELLNDFQNAVKQKSKIIGIELNKKQAYQLALKEITELWQQKTPTE